MMKIVSKVLVNRLKQLAFSMANDEVVLTRRIEAAKFVDIENIKGIKMSELSAGGKDRLQIDKLNTELVLLAEAGAELKKLILAIELEHS